MNFNLFGKKKTASATTATPARTVTRTANDPASTVVKLKESLAQQDKR